MIFHNMSVQGSQEFDEFAEFLGTKIRLEGWEGFRGGLDTKGIHLLTS